MNYSGMLKKELVQECTRLGIDFRGNKPDLIKRLEEEAQNEFELVANNYKKGDQVPKDDNLYYRCALCKTAIPSLPHSFVRCGCGNVGIDLDYFRMFVHDMTQLEVVRRIRKET